MTAIEDVKTGEFANKRLAMQAGEASRRDYTVEPVGERDPARPWRLIVAAPSPSPGADQ